MRVNYTIKSDVKSLLEMLCNVWQNPFERPGMDLCCISNGATLPEDVISDVLNAEEIGRAAWKSFRLRRLSENRDLKFLIRSLVPN